jgi:hypothetical protein
MYMREKTRIRLHQNEIPKERGNIIQRQKEREGEESKIISNQNGTHKTYYIYIYIYTYVCMYVLYRARARQQLYIVPFQSLLRILRSARAIH